MKGGSFLSQFTMSKRVFAIRIPAKLTSQYLKATRPYLLSSEGISAVRKDDAGDASKKILLFSEEELPEQLQYLMQDTQVEPTSVEVELKPQNFTLQELLRRCIPEPLPIPSSYEQVGHIAHFNLREELVPYGPQIGQAIILKNPKTIRTVIAGDDDFDVDLKESNCRFLFNFRKVYWNSRLQTEHDRMIQRIPSGSVVCDLFAGIGPFAVPLAARKSCTVFANDLNPASYEALLANAALNKCSDLVRASNLDARECFRALCDNRSSYPFQYALMNLPKDAVEFLDVFVNSLQPSDQEFVEPHVYCYAFSAAEDPEAEIRARVAAALATDVDKLPQSLVVRKVRHVSPKKWMYCVEIDIPKEICVRSSQKRKSDGELELGK